LQKGTPLEERVNLDDISQGSLAEVEYYLILALDLKYITQPQYEQAESLRAETGFLLHRLIESLGRN
jgi:four helix bundle protein